MNGIPETITYTEAVERYKCDRQALRKKVEDGTIRAFRPGLKVLLVLDDADAWFLSTAIKAPNRKPTRRKRKW
ncbi:MAG: hypothetical protein KQH59_18360 [Desulfobulbaceae bacterium]|nr:hypothetical protein [Desulfobulbaceae bacterium]